MVPRNIRACLLEVRKTIITWAYLLEVGMPLFLGHTFLRSLPNITNWCFVYSSFFFLSSFVLLPSISIDFCFVCFYKKLYKYTNTFGNESARFCCNGRWCRTQLSESWLVDMCVVCIPTYNTLSEGYPRYSSVARCIPRYPTDLHGIWPTSYGILHDFPRYPTAYHGFPRQLPVSHRPSACLALYTYSSIETLPSSPASRIWFKKKAPRKSVRLPHRPICISYSNTLSEGYCVAVGWWYFFSYAHPHPLVASCQMLSDADRFCPPRSEKKLLSFIRSYETRM